MKKVLLIVAAIFCSSISVKATHLMGGEMVVTHVSGNQYIIHLTAYRDTLGIPFATVANFKVYNNSGGLVSNHSVPADAVTGWPLSNVPYGVEVYTFHDTIVVPAAGIYTVEWSNCCRNGAIQNLAQPLAENMFLHTKFTHFANATNSTPEFLAPPVTYLPINQAWQYNSLPFDIDGDSLVWSIDTPLTNFSMYCAGYNSPSADTSGPFLMDPVSGQISWTPNMLGNFVASIRVEEFRAGVKIGEIIRDYQMIVVPDTNKLPKITNINLIPMNSSGHRYLNLNVNTSYSVALIAEDLEGDPVEFLAFGEPFILNNNPASFSSVPYNVTDRMGTFSWMPNANQARINPYLMVLRVKDRHYSFDETVMINVGNFTSVQEFEGNSLGQLYPNPSNGLITIPIQLNTESEVQLQISDMKGAVVKNIHLGKMSAGMHIRLMHLNIDAGTYSISLFKDQNLSDTQRFVVSE